MQRVQIWVLKYSTFSNRSSRNQNKHSRDTVVQSSGYQGPWLRYRWSKRHGNEREARPLFRNFFSPSGQLIPREIWNGRLMPDVPVHFDVPTFATSTTWIAPLKIQFFTEMRMINKPCFSFSFLSFFLFFSLFPFSLSPFSLFFYERLRTATKITLQN